MSICVLLTPAVSAQTPQGSFDAVLINSIDWRDLYSGMVYANYLDIPFDFVVPDAADGVKPLTFGEDVNSIYLIQSEKNPVVFGYESTLRNSGYEVQVLVSSDGKATNLELAEELNTKNFVLMDDTYGYNAIAVAPYARLTKSYVVFVDKSNIEGVYALLTEKNAENVIIYDYIDKSILERLSEFDPEIISKEDKFDNNIEIVKRYMAIKPVNQITLTGGEYFERGMMAAENPILFLGAKDVPSQIIDYVSDSGILVGELVGSELSAPARKLKFEVEARDENVKFFLVAKIGQGATSSSGAIAPLDLFYLPRYVLNVSVDSVNYNQETRNLEVLYKNEEDVVSYFRDTIRVLVDGELVQTTGETSSVRILPEEELGRVYPVDLSSYDLEISTVVTNVFLQYGSSVRTFDWILNKDYPTGLVEISDASNIEVLGLGYDKIAQTVKVVIRNAGETSTYYRVSAAFAQDDETLTLTQELVGYLNPGETKTVVFEDVELSEADIRDNKQDKVLVQVSYGERENFLSKLLTRNMDLDVSAVEAVSLIYDRGSKQLQLAVKSNSDVTSYFRASVKVFVGGEQKVLTQPQTDSLATGSIKQITFENVEMTSSDLKVNTNANVMVSIAHGESSDALPIITEKELALEVIGGSNMLLYAGIVIVVLVVAALVLKTSGKKGAKTKPKKGAKSRKK